ncbi:MAG: DEAD/DEAH box helicase [Thermoguttaceae bacterium]
MGSLVLPNGLPQIDHLHGTREDGLTQRSACSLSAQEQLLFQQLAQSSFWWEKNGESLRGRAARGGAPDKDEANAIPERLELTRGLVLHDWQNHCVEAWFKNDRRGVIKVVTGAGKTILALAIAERLQQTEVPSLRIAIVVPTVVLLSQWQEELAKRGNLPATAIGLMGGGHSDQFRDDTRILICVLNSAAKKLAQAVEDARIADRLLLIVDECHRAGAAEMQHIFRTRRAFSLGLSATPERSEDLPVDDETADTLDGDEKPASFEDSVVGQELGPVVFEMSYADAILRGVLPPFHVVHYGLSLSSEERGRYDYLSKQIKELRERLESGSRRGLALVRWCRSRAAAQNPGAAQFLALTGERKRLLYRISERNAAVEEILRRSFAQSSETKAILFHESIDEVMALFAQLRAAGYPVVAEHSQFPDSMRAESLRLFRQGVARVIVSARSLIEGFNVPSADLGIIVAASASVRQRVQTLGRLLRRSRTKEGAEKQATLYVLYASETVDELIYEKADWAQFIGADRNDYMRWSRVGESEPETCPGPPRRPALDEGAVDVQSLQPGGPYPGDSEQGRQYSLDTQGNVRDENGGLVNLHPQLRKVLIPIQKTGGRFRITPTYRFVTRLEKTKDGWRAVYLGQLDAPLVAAGPDETVDARSRSYEPGDTYPLGRARGRVFSVLQRDKRLIADKIGSRVRFVVPAERLSDLAKRALLRQSQQQLARAYARGHRISKITVTDEGHIVYVFENQAYFVGNAPEGADGFVFEEKTKVCL